jgi:phosphoribosylanthranilate isomerase
VKITKVTITGADDVVNVKDLEELTDEFPYVEWGILVGSRAGIAKFPEAKWITKVRSKILPMHLSVHYCGESLKRLLKNSKFDPEVISGHVPPERMQLNLGYVTEETERQVVMALMQYRELEVILPLKDSTKALTKYSIKHRNLSFLFDSSGGNGISPEAWPRPVTGVKVGYAGGLGPTNIKEELEKMNEVVGEGYVWVDMENNVRTGSYLDLDKVVTCLRAARKYVEQ